MFIHTEGGEILNSRAVALFVTQETSEGNWALIADMDRRALSGKRTVYVVCVRETQEEIEEVLACLYCYLHTRVPAWQPSNAEPGGEEGEPNFSPSDN